VSPTGVVGDVAETVKDVGFYAFVLDITSQRQCCLAVDAGLVVVFEPGVVPAHRVERGGLRRRQIQFLVQTQSAGGVVQRRAQAILLPGP
jgi:hypothetical protein